MLYNDEPLIKMLNGFTKENNITLEEALLQNYEECFDLISNFGIGILIFPTLVLALDG